MRQRWATPRSSGPFSHRGLPAGVCIRTPVHRNIATQYYYYLMTADEGKASVEAEMIEKCYVLIDLSQLSRAVEMRGARIRRERRQGDAASAARKTGAAVRALAPEVVRIGMRPSEVPCVPPFRSRSHAPCIKAVQRCDNPGHAQVR